MGKSKKKKTKKPFFIKLDHNLEKVEKNNMVRASNPEAAAKKFWVTDKSLENIYLKDASGEIHIFNPSSWLKKTKGSYKQFRTKRK